MTVIEEDPEFAHDLLTDVSCQFAASESPGPVLRKERNRIVEFEIVAHVVNLQLQFNDLRYLSSFGGAINRQASRI